MARTAIIAGVGPGLGESLARRFAAEGCRVALFARSDTQIEPLADDLPDPGEGLAVPTDIADVEAIRDGFDAVREAFGSVDALVNHASAASRIGLMDTSVEAFEAAWAVDGRGAFVCSQEAVGDTFDTGGGTVSFTGATSAVQSLSGAIGFTAAKFAARPCRRCPAERF
jgi:NAD(P)-dependent dehydrogenase (short-subunit alcohol dehydrogenase family)